jgi:hypothetical protein
MFALTRWMVTGFIWGLLLLNPFGIGTLWLPSTSKVGAWTKWLGLLVSRQIIKGESKWRWKLIRKVWDNAKINTKVSKEHFLTFSYLKTKLGLFTTTSNKSLDSGKGWLSYNGFSEDLMRMQQRSKLRAEKKWDKT